jgi:hypothetical protein
MKKFIKYFSISSLLAFCALLAFGKVGTIYQGATGATGLVTEAMQLLSGNTTWDVAVGRHGYAPSKPSTDVTLFLNAGNQWVSPISQYGLTSGRIPMAFTSGSQTFVDSQLSQDFTGNIVYNGTHDFSIAGTFTISSDTANTLLYLDGSKHAKSVTLGPTLSLSAGTLSTTAGGGNVTATPTTGAGGFVALFNNDAGTDLAGTAGLKFFGGVLGDGTIGASFANVTTTTLTVGGQTFAGASSGWFVPTLTAVFDSSSLNAHTFFWQRIGNVVHVSGVVDYLSTGHAQFRVSLPVGSNFATVDDCNGAASNFNGTGQAAAQFTARVTADTLNDQAYVSIGNATLGASALFTAQISFDYFVQ